jgi:LacI family transcriptional regulator
MNTFARELAQQGITIQPGRYRTCDPKWQCGYEIGMEMLTNNPEIDGIVGGNDLIALGIMRAARELGRRIPDDLALIGADDILIASQMTPPLTTFRINSYENGKVAAKLLLLRMAGDLTYREYMYKTELVIRGST